MPGGAEPTTTICVSSPNEPELEFFVELVPEGALTPLLYRLNVGDTLSLRKAPKGRFLINGEPTENRLSIGQKGSLRVDLESEGRAAHSASPDEGCSTTSSRW